MTAMLSVKHCIIATFLLFSVLNAGAQDFDIKHYDIDITVRENGALRIRETVDVFFTKAKHGIYKDIPTHYSIDYQANLEKAKYKFLQNDLLTMPITGIKVQPATYTLESLQNVLRIKIGDEDKTVEGSQRYIIEYEVDNIAAFYNNHVDINWNLIGEQWKSRIEKATYTLHFPKPQSPTRPIVYSTFTGYVGSNANHSQSAWVDDRTLKGNITQPLELEQAWTVTLSFPEEYITYEKGDESFLAQRFIIQNYNTHYTVRQDGTTEVSLRADLKFVNTVNELWVDIENFSTEKGFGLSGRWLDKHTYYTIEKVQWQGATQDPDDPFRVHFDGIKAGDRRTLQLNYTLKGNVINDPDHPGYSRIVFSHKNILLNEPILASQTTISLPVTASQATWKANVLPAFKGAQLSSRTEGNDIIIESKSPLSGEEAMYQPSVVIPSNAIAALSFGSMLHRWWMNNHWLFYALFPLGYIIWLWYTKGRDKRITIVPQYYPPQNMTPAEAGILIDDKLHERDIIALIPYWAAQGLIRIEELETTKMLGLMKDVDYKFMQLKPLPTNAPHYEKRLFDGLFGWRNVVLLSSLQLTFYTTMNTVKQLLADKIKANQHYEGKGIKAGLAMRVLGFVLLFFAVMMVNISYQGFSAIHFFSIETGIGAFIIGLTMIVLSRKMPKKSLLGAEVYQKLAGYRMFMQTVEQPRLAQLIKEDPHYFDKTLPYAMVFGMTDNWSGKFDSLNVPPPSWYASTSHGYSSSQFARRFSDASQTMSSTFTGAPSKSGSSGGSSSSGGGFGGGGGGSW